MFCFLTCVAIPVFMPRPDKKTTIAFLFKPKPPYHLLARAVLIALCPAFFTVQLFFNFGVFRNTTMQRYELAGTAIARNHAAKADSKSADHHHAFRLNKHFQPESLPSFNLLVIERPVEFIRSGNQFPYSDHFISPSFFETPALRGPPPVSNLS